MDRLRNNSYQLKLLRDWDGLGSAGTILSRYINVGKLSKIPDTVRGQAIGSDQSDSHFQSFNRPEIEQTEDFTRDVHISPLDVRNNEQLPDEGSGCMMTAQNIENLMDIDTVQLLYEANEDEMSGVEVVAKQRIIIYQPPNKLRNPKRPRQADTRNFKRIAQMSEDDL